MHSPKIVTMLMLFLAPQVHAGAQDWNPGTGEGHLPLLTENVGFFGWILAAEQSWSDHGSLARSIFASGDANAKPGTWTSLAAKEDPLSRGMLLYLPLDDGSIADESGRNRSATVQGAVPGPGQFADCFWFDGIDDYIRITDFPYGPGFSVSFWFNSSENAGTFYQYMFSHGKVHAQNTANFYFVEDANAVAGGKIKTNPLDENDLEASDRLFTEAGLSDGTWHLYTVTMGSNGTHVYLDGTLLRSAPDLGGDAIDPPGPIIIGSRSDLSPDRSYEGYLDDLRLYDRVLTAAEVRTLHSRQRAGESN